MVELITKLLANKILILKMTIVNDKRFIPVVVKRLLKTPFRKKSAMLLLEMHSESLKTPLRNYC